MEFGDSRNALFTEPNAYIQKFNADCKEKEIKKIVFQEPYETLPNFYINNNFIKHKCDCVSNNQNNKYNSNLNKHDNNCGCGNKNLTNRSNHECSCNHENCNLNNKQQHNNSCNNGSSEKNNAFGIDFKSLLPLIGLFNKGGADITQLVGLLNNTNNPPNGNNSNPMNLFSSLFSNKDMMTGIMNLFKGGGFNLFSKKQMPSKKLKTTDFEIKNYTRVE